MSPRLALAFFGTPELACPALEALCRAGHEVRAVYTQPDRPAGRGRRLVRQPVAALADRLGLQVRQPAHVREALDELAGLGAQAAAVVAFGQLLPPAALAAFPRGAVNLHTSLLPALRGASPINAAILAGLAQSGVTTMFMDRGLDTGDIILQRALALDPQETAGSLAGRLAGLGAELLVETMDLLARGQAPRRPQDPALASYAPLLKKGDGLLDWRRPAVELDRRVRGLDPWPGAFTLFAGQPLKLYGPTALETSAGAPPGTVLAPFLGRQDHLWVACGQGALGVGALQAPGKKRLEAAAFLRGCRLEPGSRLGA